MLLSPAGSQAGLSHGSLWNKLGRSPGGMKKEPDLRQQQAQLALTRQRLLTLCFGEMETVRLLPNSYNELDAVAREWIKPPRDAVFSLRVPVEFASFQASRLVNGPYVYLTSEDSFQIATMGVQGLRVEIASDGASSSEDDPPPPPPPPVLEMPGTFNLELIPGQHISLDTIISSDGDMDMARMDDGTTVDGQFWGKLEIVHDGDNHKLEFTGTRVPSGPEGGAYSAALAADSRSLVRLAAAVKQTTAKCHLSILPPAQQYCDIFLSCSPYWRIGATWPPAEAVPEADNKIKYFLKVNPGGAMEHYESMMVTTTLYYEAIPDSSMIEPNDFISSRNGFAMPLADFMHHLMIVLDQLGMSMQARTNFITNNMSAFCAHKNIAYRFLSPRRIASAIDISVTAESCVFTRLFMIFRGITEDDMQAFAHAGEKEANQMNWREVVGWTENSKDTTLFRVLETSIMEVS